MNHRTSWLTVAVTVVLALFMSPLALRTAAAAEDKAFDKRFIKEAAQYSYAENELSRLARDKSNSDGVKHFAEIVIGGQKKLLDELKDVADKHDYHLSDDLTDKQRETKSRLARLDGTNFDVQYLSSSIEDHKAMIDLFERGAKESEDENLRKFADRKLPMLHEHLANAEELYRKVKAKDR
jgi:putative membrane protein